MSRGPVPARLVVLASGFGSNLQAILDACSQGRLPARVSAVVSDRRAAPALVRARQAGVPALYLPASHFEKSPAGRCAYDESLADEVTTYEPDLVVLAGWMRVLSSSFLGRFPHRVINLHPALPGTYPGVDAIRRAYQQCRTGGSCTTGVMVHFVPDEGVDNGPVVLQEAVPIRPQDELADLEERVHRAEQRLLVQAIATLICTS
jgi:phosphoribosylglycinamide formyltransferase 1